MTQIELLRLIDYARTDAEIREAWRLAETWLNNHPDDLSVRSSLEGLAMIEAALLEI